MPAVSSVIIGMVAEKQVYRPGEAVMGIWTLTVEEPIMVKSIKTYCYGAALAKWSDVVGFGDQLQRQTFFGRVVTQFGKKGNRRHQQCYAL